MGGGAGGDTGESAGRGTDPAAAALTAPWATTSSGCSITVGAMPSRRCSWVAICGMRVEPPTRNRPTASPGRTPLRDSVDAVMVTVRSISGPAARSNSSLVTCTSAS
jgi:hypothetical protein